MKDEEARAAILRMAASQKALLHLVGATLAAMVDRGVIEEDHAARMIRASRDLLSENHPGRQEFDALIPTFR